MKWNLSKRRIIGVSCGVTIVCLIVGQAFADKPGDKVSPNSSVPGKAVPDVRCDLSPEEQMVVRELRSRLAELEQRRLALEAREAALNALKVQIADQLKELRQTQRQVSEVMDVAAQEARTSREARIVQLAGIIKKMKPRPASEIIARQNVKVAIAVLDSIGSRPAGKILAQLPPPVAVKLAEALVALPMKKKTEGDEGGVK